MTSAQENKNLSSQAAVTVIIPTMATAARFASLQRAVASVRASSTSPVKIIAVINGLRANVSVTQWLFKQPDGLVECLPIPSAPNAVRRGRELVDTPFFSTLDDDDEYLPLGTDAKLFLMLASGDDVVVTDGHRHLEGKDGRFYWRIGRAAVDPLESLMSFSWLNSANSLYRSDSVGVELFEDGHPYGEWTWIAFKLAQAGKRIQVSNLMTFRINDTPHSLSKSRAYSVAYLSLYSRMINAGVPNHIKHLIKRKRSAFWHEEACAALRDGNRLKAAAAHLRSLSEGGGWRYLSFTRHLLKPRWFSLIRALA